MKSLNFKEDIFKYSVKLLLISVVFLIMGIVPGCDSNLRAQGWIFPLISKDGLMFLAYTSMGFFASVILTMDW